MGGDDWYRRISIESKPESPLLRRSLLIFMKAVSVLWQGWKSDWKSSCRELWDRWE